MLEIIFVAAIVTLFVWAVVDIYFISVVFEPFHFAVEKYEEHGNWFIRHFAIMLNCPYCFSHWVATPTSLAVSFLMGTPLWAGIVLIPIAARLAAMLRENTFPPTSGGHPPVDGQ
jgi:hypothetical protein